MFCILLIFLDLFIFIENKNEYKQLIYLLAYSFYYCKNIKYNQSFIPSALLGK